MNIVTVHNMPLAGKFDANTYMVTGIMPRENLMQLSPLGTEPTILGGDDWLTPLMPSAKIGTIITL